MLLLLVLRNTPNRAVNKAFMEARFASNAPKA